MVSTRSASKQSGNGATGAAAAAPEKRAAESSAAGEAERPAKKAATPKAEKAVFEVGKPVAKSVTLLNQDGKEVAFESIYKDSGVVIFMYPRANTPGCTKQACGFRDHIQEIRDAGFAVYGLSADSPKSLLNWKNKEKLSYDLLSDPKHELIKYFGSSIGGSKIKRSHVVILKGGVVGDISGQVSPADSVDKAVAFVTSHKQDGASTSSSSNAKSIDDEEKAALVVGKKVTFDVELHTESSKPVRFQELVAERGVVFFMFPKADTPGCTVQACGFNDHIEEIKAAGFQVFGLSGDSPAELLAWKEKKSYQYSFLSDPKHELIAFFGSSENGGKKVQRSHVVVLKGGEVGDVQHKISPQDSFTKALAFVKRHAGAATQQ
ncbi:hypothetical protein PINS_up002333 [Pythium insidiosum]|nr:hypothetical protein PINS_up002333 [Pythium insidiosum]